MHFLNTMYLFILQASTLVLLERLGNMYRTRAIITRSRFETALDYKPRILRLKKVSSEYKPLCNINLS